MSIRHHNSTRTGFSLVELLVVVAVIVLLAALLMTAIGPATIAPRELEVIAEINVIGQALEKFKLEHGEYPPMTGDKQKIRRFLINMYPDHKPTAAEIDQLAALTPAEALVFWLGGMPVANAAGAKDSVGFARDGKDPFRGPSWGTWQPWAGDHERRTVPYYRFDARNLVDRGGTAGFWEYVPEGMDRPLVYFPHDEYAGAQFHDAAGSIAVAYESDLGGYACPRTYQIVAAGLDRNFGAAAGRRVFPSGTGYSEHDEDNLTNFSPTRLGAAR